MDTEGYQLFCCELTYNIYNSYDFKRKLIEKALIGCVQEVFDHDFWQRTYERTSRNMNNERKERKKVYPMHFLLSRDIK